MNKNFAYNISLIEMFLYIFFPNYKKMIKNEYTDLVNIVMDYYKVESVFIKNKLQYEEEQKNTCKDCGNLKEECYCGCTIM